MARRRAAGLLLALAACIATATAAPTASNHTSLDLYDGAPEGCYYNFQHYGEGDRIMTNEPCLNCTCHNRMLMCYLKVCPFTKPIGQDCTIEKRADQCCPIVTCPDVPVDLLTSTTTSPAEYGPTGIGKLDKFGCSINGKYFSEGSKVPPSPNKPCEHCYCIRNMTTCVMQECTLHVDGCTPIYHKDVCCPVRYSCDHPEDEMPLLDDLSTTVRPTPGFLLTTTTVPPVTQMSQDCVYENQVFPDGALIKTEKACDHCYCMKGDIVCVVQECGTPMENEGKNCTALPPREGVCCPDTYICEGDEPTAGPIDAFDRTTIAVQEELTSLSPPRRTSSEGSGYRNDDENPYTELPVFEPEVEGSGEEEETKRRTEMMPESATSGLTDDILAITEESHEYIPMTTPKPVEAPEITTVMVSKDDDKLTSDTVVEESFESQSTTPSKIDENTMKESDEALPNIPQSHEVGSGEPEENNLSPDESILVTPTASIIEDNTITTPSEITNRDDTSESTLPVAISPVKDDEKINIPQDIEVKSTTASSIDHDIIGLSQGESAEVNESLYIVPESNDFSQSTTQKTIIESNVIVTTESAEPSVTGMSIETSNTVSGDDIEPHVYVTSSSAPSLDDEFVTTELQEQDVITESSKRTEMPEPPKHATTNTPMLEEIEKDTTEYTGVEHIPSDVTQDDTSNIFTTTVSHIPSVEKKPTTEQTEHEDHNLDTTDKYNEISPIESHKIPELATDTNIQEKPSSQDSDKEITVPDEIQTVISEDQNKISQTTPVSTLETESGTTEPDKGLNTIPSDTIDEDISGSDEKHKTTIVDEKLTTESEIDNRLGDETGTKLTTDASITSVHSVEPSTLTTETAFRKEDTLSSTESQESSELTTVKTDIYKEELSTSMKDIITTEASLDLQKDITSSTPKYTVYVEDTTLAKDDAITTSSQSLAPETAVSEKEFTTEEETATIISNIPQTTEANQEDNEIINEPRIPGEGDCLLNGITYTNESAIPSSNKCQSGCKCISSIIKCDPIICSLPPEMDNCKTIYDSPDACCPTYVCDHRSETNPPQSHSQMSGTESPIVAPITCQGDECVISGEQIAHKKPSSDCKSGICPSQTNGLDIDSAVSQIPEIPIIHQEGGCIGDNCGSTICTNENGCQAAQCEGDNCNLAPSDTSSESQPCTGIGGDCNIQNIPSKDCNTGDCAGTDAQPDDTLHKETCTEKEGCSISHVSDVPALDHTISEHCSGPDCKTPQTDQEMITAAAVHPSHEDLDKDSEKNTVGITEPSDKQHETSTMPSVNIDKSEITTSPISYETPRDQSEVEPAKQITTSKDQIELVTKPNIQNVDTTSRPSVDFNEEEYSTEEPETASDSSEIPVTPGMVTKDKQTKVPILDEISSEQPEMYVTSDDHDIKTEKPDLLNIDFVTKEQHEMVTTTVRAITLEEITTKSTEDTKTEPSQTVFDLQQQTVAPTKHDISETTTAPPSSPTHSYDITSPSNEHLLQNTEIEPYDRESEVAPESTITSTEESTKPTQYVTKPLDVIKPQEEINQGETTQTFQEENITEPPKLLIEVKPGDTVKESGTEPANVIETDDQLGITEQKEVTSMLVEGSSTESSTHADKTQEFTSTPIISEKESSTIKESYENEPSKEPQEVIKPAKDTEHKDNSEEVTTEPSELYITESLETTKTPEDITDKEFIATSITKLDDIIKPSEDTPKEDYGTESSNTDDIATEAPEKGTTALISEEIFSEPPKSYDSVPQEIPIVHVSVDQEHTTSKISQGTATEPSKIDSTEPQEIPISPEGTYQDLATTMETESVTKIPEMIVTKYDQVVPVTPEDAGQEESTSKTNEELPTEPPRTSTQQVELQSPKDTVRDSTDKVPEEYVTEPSESLQTEPQEATVPTEQKYTTTSKIFDESSTEQPHVDVTKTQENMQTPEIGILETTFNPTDSETEPSRTPETIDEHIGEVSTESPTQLVTDTENKIETSEPVMEIPKEDDEKKHTVQVLPEITTTSSEVLSSESVETTTLSHLLDGSRRTESKPLEPEEITTKIPSMQEEPPSDLNGMIDTSISDHITTTTSPEIINEIETTTSSVKVDSEQPHIESLPDELESEKRPESDAHVTSSPTFGQKDESQPDSEETMSTQSLEHPIIEHKVTSEPNEVILEDDLRTSEKYDIPTSKPTETLTESDIEVKTEYPINYTPQEELSVSQETPKETTTDAKKPADTTATILPTITEISQSGSDTPSEETYSEKPASEIEDSDKMTSGYDTTKTQHEQITTTQTIMHKTEDATKLEDNTEESYSTEKQHESSTESLDIGTESQTQIPIQVSSEKPESDVTHLSDQNQMELTSLPSKLPDIVSEPTEKTDSVPPVDDGKDTEEHISTETSIFDKTSGDDAIQKEHLAGENAISMKPSVSDQEEPSTTISSTKLTSVEITTLTVGLDSSITDSQESVDIQKIPTDYVGSSPITEKSDIVTIATEGNTLEPQEGVSELNIEATKAPVIVTDSTEPSESGILETSSPSSATEEAIEKQTTVSEEQHPISLDHIITEIPESIIKQPSLPPTTALPEHESSVSTSSPLDDAEQTVKEEDVITGDHTTETSKVTDSSDVSQPIEAYTEKQPETIHTVTPEKETSIDDYVTTIKPHKHAEYETTAETSTQGLVTPSEDSTTPSHDITIEHTLPEVEQSVPVIITDEDKASSPKESDSVQTERVTAATKKPLQETTAPEEEFIVATSKTTTTIKYEEDVSTSSPSVETTAKLTDKPVEPTVTAAPEPPKPIPTEVQPTDEVPVPDEEGSFPPSGTSGYGQEPDYVEEDQTFGPGTCRYGGKVYVSAQQIPRDDPCDFCFCFRSDIICLQQSCPPPIHGCHEEPIQGFCCPRYECPVSMATTVNVTTTTTTTTTTLPPHFPTHSYKGSAQRRGCQIKGQTYKVGEVVRASSGPCLHCTCGGDGQMKCDPKVCTPEPMLRQMIAAAVSAKRRR